MFIRRTAIKSRTSGTGYYFTHRLVETERVDGKVKQHILLNLGRHFCVPKNQWKDLAARIRQLLDSQSSLVSVELPIELEIQAQHYGSSRQGCESWRVKVPLPSVSRNGRLVYPLLGEVTNQDMRGSKSHGCLVGCRDLEEYYGSRTEAQRESVGTATEP